MMVAGGISLYGKSELVVVDENYTVNGKYYRYQISPIYGNCPNSRQQYPKGIYPTLMQGGAGTTKVSKAKVKQCFSAV